MYIEQAYKSRHQSWRYLVGVLLILFAWLVVGFIPFIVEIVQKIRDAPVRPTNLAEVLALIGSNLFLFLMLFPFAFGLLATFLTVKLLHKQSLVSLTTSRKRVDWGRVCFAFLLWGAISIISIGIAIWSSPEDYQFNLDWGPFLILCAISLTMIPLQTSFEEYFMRGYLMQGLGVMAGNRWVPLVVTSVLFGLLHLFNPEVEKLGYLFMVHYIGFGFFLGILTLMDEGLELAIGIHAANNIVVVILVTADWTVFQAPSLYRNISEPELIGWEVFIPVLLTYPLLLMLFSKKYGWTHWREKLAGKVNKMEVQVEAITTDEHNL